MLRAIGDILMITVLNALEEDSLLKPTDHVIPCELHVLFIFFFSTGDSNMQMTHEQQRICNHNVGPKETIKIVAFAGKL